MLPHLKHKLFQPQGILTCMFSYWETPCFYSPDKGSEKTVSLRIQWDVKSLICPEAMSRLSGVMSVNCELRQTSESVGKGNSVLLDSVFYKMCMLGFSSCWNERKMLFLYFCVCMCVCVSVCVCVCVLWREPRIKKKKYIYIYIYIY